MALYRAYGHSNFLKKENAFKNIHEYKKQIGLQIVQVPTVSSA